MDWTTLRTCENCRIDYALAYFAQPAELVNCKDGTRRELHLCETCATDFWDECDPGEWVTLSTGEEIQRASWRCDVCDQVHEADAVAALIDLDEVADNPGRSVYASVVCAGCQRTKRFQARNKCGGLMLSPKACNS